MINLDYIALGKRIQNFRKSKNMTQQQLSDLIDVVPSNISHIERGTNKVSLPSLVKIANVLGVTMDELLCGSLKNTTYVQNQEIANLLSDCSNTQLEAIIDIIKIIKNSIINNE